MAESPTPAKEKLAGEFDGLAVPPLDHTFLAQQIIEADQGIVDDFPMEFRNVDFTMDDLDFEVSFDDLFPNPTDGDAFQKPNYLADCIGSEAGQMDPNRFGQSGSQLIGSFDDASGTFKSTSGDCLGEAPGSNSVQMDPNFFGQPGSQLIGNSGDSSTNVKLTSSEMSNFTGNQAAGGVMVMDTSSPELHQSFSSSRVSNEVSRSLHQVSTDVSGYLNVPSPESNGSNHDDSRESRNDQKGLSDAKVLSCHSPESQGSGNCGGLNYLSDSNKSVHSSPNLGSNSVKGGVVEQKFKFEGVNANISNCSSFLLKRKKGSEDSNNVSKHQKSSIFSLSDNVNNDEDEKKMARLIRNRESAHLSRQRKKHYVEELEDKVRIMHSTIQDLNAKISYVMAENVSLKTQLGGTGVPPQVPPPPGMYPHMIYPWMSYPSPYMMKPQGSQVPLVPIPKLKPQAAAPVPKSSKKVEKKKGEVKTKKVASISFLGVLFFMLLFGGLVPLLNVRYGGVREPFMGGDSFGSGFYEKHHGRVLVVDGPVNGTGYSGKYGGKDYSSHCGRGGHGESSQQNTNKAADEFVHVGNGSDALAASLYVPRNDKLVKIDGNLIIQSVLASEKAMASHRGADRNNRETGLAVPGDLAPAIPGSHPRLYRSSAVGQRALGTVEKENAKSTMQQWFLEGVAGPLMSSGMCTEVFQFDVSSSAPGAIVRATNARNISMEERQNATRVHRNRRILNGHPVSLSRPSHNFSEEQTGTTGKQENFTGNKSLSSMVVSVLVDPREAGDTDGDGIMGPKSLSRIFVVVLVDSVKYVTYSCMLPFKGSTPLVTT
ncbi:bZIP transcription factor 17-like [Solanum dulcamara]|uniref:bZIP transcription factor 17-like n=1 Tax=Solanum dulcamara TaxID=45834 RepID=UPI0024866CC4|nr:bZIP transcription factor 17-like [Solanum dulcamara]